MFHSPIKEVDDLAEPVLLKKGTLVKGCDLYIDKRGGFVVRLPSGRWTCNDYTAKSLRKNCYGFARWVNHDWVLRGLAALGFVKKSAVDAHYKAADEAGERLARNGDIESLKREAKRLGATVRFPKTRKR